MAHPEPPLRPPGPVDPWPRDQGSTRSRAFQRRARSISGLETRDRRPPASAAPSPPLHHRPRHHRRAITTAPSPPPGARSELAGLTERYERTWAQVEQSTVDLEDLQARADQLQGEAGRQDAQLVDRARQVFMRGSATSFGLLLASEGPGVGIERASLAEAVQSRETASPQAARAARVALQQAVPLTNLRRDELRTLREDQAGLQVRLEAQLDAAEQQVAGLEAAARQRRIASGPQQGVYACPLDRHLTHFVRSWGAARSGGRRHQGTDVIGPRGVPAYAFKDGVIARHSNSRVGGTSL